MTAFDFSSYIIVFRETLEAALIVGIISAFLVKTQARAYLKYVAFSAVLALIASMALAFVFEAAVGQFKGASAEIFEGVVSLLAVAVLTYMIWWMHLQASQIRSSVEYHVENAVHQQDILALIALPFFAILREGAETILFLKAAALQTGGAVSLLGGGLGFTTAVLLVAAIFWLGTRIPLKPFFRYTEVLLVFMAAGLLAYGIHELEEAGLINGIIYPIWNVNSFLNEKQGIGALLKAIFGYNGNPSLLETLAYFGYLFGMFRFLKLYQFRNVASRSPVSSVAQ